MNTPLNRIAALLNAAYENLTGEHHPDHDAVVGLIAEAKALAEGDAGSFDAQPEVVKVKTTALTGDALSWAVAKALDLNEEDYVEIDNLYGAVWRGPDYAYDWAHGGPIIEREEISISREFSAGGIEWAAWTPAPIRDDAEAFGYGPTPLIAAMRCFVASKLGDEIEVPGELQ